MSVWRTLSTSASARLSLNDAFATDAECATLRTLLDETLAAQATNKAHQPQYDGVAVYAAVSAAECGDDETLRAVLDRVHEASKALFGTATATASEALLARTTPWVGGGCFR